MNRKKIIVLGIGTLLLAALAFLRPLRFIDNLWYDLHFNFAAREASDEVVIVGIDSESIERYGALPWSRSLMAALVGKIADAAPRAVALDFLFPRRDGTTDNDSLAAVFARTPSLVLPFRAEGITASTIDEFQPVPAELHAFRLQRIVSPEHLENIFIYRSARVSAADTLFVKYARYGGFLNVSTSSTSQKLREAVQVIGVGNDYYPSFVIAAVAAYCGVPQEEVALDGAGRILIGKRRVPITSYAATTPVNFRSEKHPVRMVSATALFDGSADPALLEGKLVFVGVTDPAAGADFFITPVAPQFPGVAVWATAALDILENRVLKETAGASALPGYLLMLMLFPGCALLFPAGKRRIAFAVSAGLVAAGFGISLLFFSSMSTVWNFPVVLYAWVFFLFWLALLRADPSIAGPVALNLEPSVPTEYSFAPPPTEEQLREKLPHTDTADFITKILTSHGADATPPSTPETLSGTLVEVAPDDLSAQPRPRPMVDNLDAIPRDLAGGTIVRLLGTGGMADVYQVWHPRLESYRAVKVLKPERNDNFLKRFETEIRIIAKLDHPNIVHCYNAGEWHSLPYLEMEYVHGASMEEVLKKKSSITVEQALIIGALVCRALHYAHSKVLTIYGTVYRGIVHRDLKPANIMLSRSGQVKLTDFGIARPGTVSLHTGETGGVVGTLPYLAPEQMEAGLLAGSVDIYALGVTIYELVAGERAFPQTEIPALLRAKSTGTFKPLTRVAHIASEVAQCIEKAMAIDPQQRFPTASAFGTELERLLFKMCGQNAITHLEALVRRVWSDTV
ncbi:MAG: CHASE2 domain-containing protein [Chitinispirillaceae bacterium]|nr:CHASE2 domain-containing protein [Chitinispirillaceae bacterium]